jgi:hypothetical protein
MRHRIYELQQRSLTPQLAAGLASPVKSFKEGPQSGI